MGDYKTSIRQQDYPSRVVKIRTLLDSLPAATRSAVEAAEPGVTERLDQLLDDVVVHVIEPVLALGSEAELDFLTWSEHPVTRHVDHAEVRPGVPAFR